MAVMMHSVNDNNNEMHFIVFQEQINAQVHITRKRRLTMYRRVQKCHPELQLPGTNVFSNYRSATSGYCIAV